MLNDAREASPVRKEVEAVASGELPDVLAMLISGPDVPARHWRRHMFRRPIVRWSGDVGRREIRIVGAELPGRELADIGVIETHSENGRGPAGHIVDPNEYQKATCPRI
jgi:hypothetical protein